MCKPTDNPSEFQVDSAAAVLPAIELPAQAVLADYQQYIDLLEKRMGWTEVDLIHNCFLMGEELGELFKAVRRVVKLFDQAGDTANLESRRQDVSEELVDVFNYLLAIANRLDIDLEQAFRDKNAHNQTRTWQA